MSAVERDAGQVGTYDMDIKRPIYDTGSMLLHWGIATLVFAVGLTSPFLDHETRPALSTFHNVGGTAALLLAVAWFVWQSLRPALPPLKEIGADERKYMTWTVNLLNVLLVLGPVSGLVLLFALGGSLGIGTFVVGGRVPVDPGVIHRLGVLHHVLGALLVMLAGGHALHSVWHHLVRRDRLLARMLPWHER